MHISLNHPAYHNPTNHRAGVGQALTIDPLAVCTRQESYHPRNVRRDGAPAQRTEARDALLDILHAGAGICTRGIMPRVGGEHVGLDAAGCDSVDRDTLGSSVGGERAREAFDGCFGPGVKGMVADAGHCGCNRGHEDYAAAS